MTDIRSMFDPSTNYDRYRVRIRIRERLDGGVPYDKALIRKWVEAGTGFEDEVTEKLIAEHLADTGEMDKALEHAAEERAGAMWCGFKSAEFEGTTRRYIETRQVKALLRECCTMLRIFTEQRGSKQVYQHGLEVKAMDGGSKIPIAEQNAGMDEGAIHVMTPQGPRNALRRVDFVGEGSELEFQVWIFGTSPQETRHMGQDNLIELLKLAQEDGLGANRSQGSGKFDVIDFELMAKHERKLSANAGEKKNGAKSKKAASASQ